jgi:hypothetical protein
VADGHAEAATPALPAGGDPSASVPSEVAAPAAAPVPAGDGEEVAVEPTAEGDRPT